MCKVKTVLLLGLMCLLPLTVSAQSQAVSSTELIEDAAKYDGEIVVFTGEIIGDIMNRGDHTWINVSDGSNAIGVWVDSSDMQGITLAGSYDNVGDTVCITGIFHRVCSLHGGDFDIHAQRVDCLKKGYAVEHTLHPIRLLWGLPLWVASIVFLLLVIRNNRWKHMHT